MEISIEATNEKDLSEEQLIERVSKAFFELYGKNCQIHKINRKPYIRIDFQSQDDFAKIYERQYSMYVYLFDEFLQENLSIENLFAPWLKKSEKKGDNEQWDNYLVLRYRTNCIEPMRQFYEFSAKINRFFGSRIINEEIIDGYLRFIHTKEDFEILLLPGDIEDAWRETFKIRGVDLDHPLIKKFFVTMRHWKEEIWKK